MNALRLFAVGVSVSLGGAVALLTPQPRAALAGTVVSLCGTLVLRRLPLLLVSSILLGWLLGSNRLGAVDTPLVIGSEAVDLVGTVVQPPRADRGETVATLQLHAIAAGGRTVASRARITLVVRAPPWTLGTEVASVPEPLDLGDRLQLTAVRLRPPGGDGFRARLRQARNRISARVFADAGEVERIGSGGGPLVRVARAGRSAVRDASAVLPAATGGLIRGITIGDVSGILPAVAEDFRRTGLTHLVAVSGANVAIVLAALLLVLRAIRVPVALLPWLLGLATVGFCAISAFEPSVVRAGAMALLVLLSMVLGAARRATTLLAAGFVPLSVADPFLACELGFQLSILATLGLLTLARHLAPVAGRRPLLLAIVATVGAQITTLPLLAATTGRMSLVGIPANLLTAPMVAPATILGFVSASLGSIVPPARYLAAIAHPFLAMMLVVARLLADLPFAVVSLPNGPLGATAVIALIGVALVASMRGRRAQAFVVALALVAPVAIAALVEANRPPPLQGLSITMLDVGQGEAILITEGDHAMLVDGGRDPDDVPRMLRDRGIHRLDYLVVSHAHDDHISGLVPVVERAAIGAVLDPGMPAPIEDYSELLEVVDERNIPRILARAGQTYPLGNAMIEILWPAEPLLTGTESDLNENSIVFRIDMGQDSFLYAGETQEESQRILLERDPGDLRADILKVSHHGSARMEPAFYEATGAEIAMIPVGPNRYGHPAAETLLALDGMRILRSDAHGDASVTVDGSGRLAVRTER